ncbi:DNA recombination protein RmuC [Devosia ginsengisoli]|uniref:DNA recombination protein RmuC homolog n=1 Tax=Devosia ginsengisoli TaxID=400770 RepID=A0A5B8M014_9HYPH|nr:DNA recombination protein RmuC [Devosia ginsengisoli]QDZ13000.1 DNA recombination protein RmuC [Devosia ginsengisoli]
MDSVLFVLGDFPVTLAQVSIGGVALAGLLLLGVTIAIMRASARRTVEAGAELADQLQAGLVAQIGERDRRIQDLDHQVRVERERGADLLDREREKSAELLADAAALKARLAEQSAQSEANLARFLNARQQMTDEFKAIAGDVLKTQSETFTRQNREQVDTLLKPLNEKIVEFHTGMISDRASMTEQIRALAASNLQITTEANNLTRALKGNSQMQGAWGEMILSTILEGSGLREGEQFITQQSHTGEDGSRVRTDVEVLMPNNDRLVIDSKVSLTAFAAYTSSEDEDRSMHLQAHIASIRSHIKTLGDKSYQRHAQSKMDFVMMFVPIESALATAIQQDASLVEFGMSRGVMLATPTTLMTVLRTVRNVWDIEKRHQNAEQIAERAGALYDKVVGFLVTMDKVGSNLERAQQGFADARGQLATGKGSVVRQVEMLRELGAKSNKQLPAGWDNGDDDMPKLRLVNEDPGDLS